MKKIRIPEKLKRFVLQYPQQYIYELFPPKIEDDIYIMTVIMAIINYSLAIICVVIEILIYIFHRALILYILAISVSYFILDVIIILVVTYLARKKTQKAGLQLDRNFTIDKHDKKE